MFFKSIMEEALGFEIEEYYQVLSNGEEVSEGDMKKVIEGLRPEMIKYDSHDEDRFDVYDDLHGSAKVVSTSLYQDYDMNIIRQDFVPDSFLDDVMENGPEHAVGEAVAIEESFIENGYVYSDLKPANIRFQNGNGMAVDYLDRLSVLRLDEVNDIERALSTSYDLFVGEAAEELNADPVEIERMVDRHSKYTEAREFTGEPYIDFRFNPNQEE
ncbi:MAG: hypothetical protein ACI977_000163 [Candidatus Nanohaloarchaea archaeon]|jgi:hypothetical protein